MSDDLGQFVALLNTAKVRRPALSTALERLRAHSTEVISDARRLLGPAPDGLADNWALRHSVVLAVAAMRDPGALDLLSEVALNPQPLPPSKRRWRVDCFRHALNTGRRRSRGAEDNRRSRRHRWHRGARWRRTCCCARRARGGFGGAIERAARLCADGARRGLNGASTATERWPRCPTTSATSQIFPARQ